MLSIAMSPQVKCLVGSKDFSVGTVISPDRKNPKKHRVAAAHIIIISLSVR